ncbi:hypothetical protein M2103_001840 [Ereboglobus sp. PH5-5]|uniref:GIY-YIG nuclease family protein n=1 Tax=Ereboglobus sp. PH5-5 TaxID=2940529 RepID=UPI00240558EA|nr:GIY-YIG nuclease family protein [Ereboglobus sp. PH5-5]MDF9833608.1 hypothetical protein [Ereboglobus sp. PH5-5]
MNFNDLLIKNNIDPSHVIMLRHRPYEPALNKAFLWIASERHDLFDAYQATQPIPLEKAMARLTGSGYIASFIGHKPGRALFVGIYKIESSTPLSYAQFWSRAEFKELSERFGMAGFQKDKNHPSLLYFNLKPTGIHADWNGKLTIAWTPPERSWWRRAHRNDMRIVSILEESALLKPVPKWREINLSWQELQALPQQWRVALAQWRGVYYIFDKSDGKGYVGSAYGEFNIYGRWLNYAKSGHGGNKLLKNRDPRNFQFSIVERVSPDMPPDEIISLERTWKKRLHTEAPNGLNEN